MLSEEVWPSPLVVLEHNLAGKGVLYLSEVRLFLISPQYPDCGSSLWEVRAMHKCSDGFQIANLWVLVNYTPFSWKSLKHSLMADKNG